MSNKVISSVKNRPVIWFLGFLAATLIPIFTFFDVPVPKPAWTADIERLEIKQLNMHIQLLEDQLEREQRKKLDNAIEQEKLVREGKPVPNIYIQQQANIESRIEKLKSQLRAARDRQIELAK